MFQVFCVLIKSFLNWSANISACRPSNHVRRTTSVKTLAAFHLTGTCISPSEGGSCYSGTCVVVVVVAFVLCLSCCSATADTFLNRYLLDSPWLYDQSCHNCYTHDLKCSFLITCLPTIKALSRPSGMVTIQFLCPKTKLGGGKLFSSILNLWIPFWMVGNCSWVHFTWCKIFPYSVILAKKALTSSSNITLCKVTTVYISLLPQISTSCRSNNFWAHYMSWPT